ncbi:Bacterial Ig-like domain (group 3) [Pseudoscardovia radai]|uniref:Bacterial Ig-like domain (Group 3) n=1 Tax=Pseudoscardovia radai TaxID=987066 RepID=A0A261ESZ6_9BIFI|nr:hypothetical protein [Pseudoscardovia radai]OZG49776.1 Bacterial Ig-like domain (group 3) [Pseudoscardovia radai]
MKYLRHTSRRSARRPSGGDTPPPRRTDPGGRIVARIRRPRHASADAAAAHRRLLAAALALVAAGACLLLTGLFLPGSHADDGEASSHATPTEMAPAPSGTPSDTDGLANGPADASKGMACGAAPHPMLTYARIDGGGASRGVTEYGGRRLAMWSMADAKAYFAISLGVAPLDAGASASCVTEKDETTGEDDDDTAESDVAESGAPQTEVELMVPAPVDLDGAVLGEAQTLRATPDVSGAVRFVIDGEGLYTFADIRIRMQAGADDVAAHSITLPEALATAPRTPGIESGGDAAPDQNDILGQNNTVEYDTADYDAVVVDNHTTPGRGLSVGLGTEDAGGGMGASSDPAYYIPGAPCLMLTVTDRWFPLARHIAGESVVIGGGSITSVSESDALDFGLPGAGESGAGAQAPEAQAPLDWTRRGDSWSAAWRILPRAPLGPHASDPLTSALAVPGLRAVEGVYRYDASYSGLAEPEQAVHACHAASPGHAPCEFLADWTAPAVGEVVVIGDARPLGAWLVARPGVGIGVSGITDSGSGIDPSAAVLDTAAASSEGLDVGLRDGHACGHAAGECLLATVTASSARYDPAEFSLTVRDRAGNAAVIPSLGDANGALERVEGLAVDEGKPSVRFENAGCELVDGLYCASSREIRVIVSDPFLDVIRSQDPGRVIVDIDAIGATGRERISLAASDARPCSAEGNLTGTDRPAGGPDIGRAPTDSGGSPSVSCAPGENIVSATAREDGEWSVSARMGDPFHGEVTAADRFIVDTTAPVFTVDAGDVPAVNGRYYASARTLAIRCVERNTTPGVGRITITRDGKPVEQASLWCADGSRPDAWDALVRLDQDGTYTVRVDGTDAAGHAADSLDLGEFVIDTTPPDVSVTGVDDGHAYAGDVAPGIDMHDANPDGGIEWTLTGTRCGLVASRPSDGASVRMDGFAHIPASDDVYDLDVTARDMAGHVATRRVTFSVNRFGSTYAFDDGTRDMRGGYLREAGPVTVHEINVSGLVGASSVAVAHDTAVRTLGGGDYETQTQQERGWSRTTYTIPREVFAADGYYRVMVSSIDAAGNHSTNLMDGSSVDRNGGADLQFAIDSTAPRLRLTGLGGAGYDSLAGVAGDGPEHGIIHVRDNMELDSTSLTIDGVAAGQWNGASADGQAIEVPDDGAGHDVIVESRDRAGNMTRIVIPGARLSRPAPGPAVGGATSGSLRWLVPWSFAAASVIACAVVAVITSRKHREDEEDDDDR